MSEEEQTEEEYEEERENGNHIPTGGYCSDAAVGLSAKVPYSCF